MKIYAPNPEYTGTYTWGDGTVFDFKDGVASHKGDLPPAIRNYLSAAGYGLGSKPGAPDDAPTVPDPRDGLTEQVGSTLRDAAVDPQEGDFLPPVNAGKEGPDGNPHGPNVVSPEIHASTGQAVVPGVVPSDPKAQESKESEFAERTRIDGEPVPDVSLSVADPDPADTSTGKLPGEPAGNAKRAEWVDFARTQGAPDAELGEDETGLSRDELRAKYGS